MLSGGNTAQGSELAMVKARVDLLVLADMVQTIRMTVRVMDNGLGDLLDRRKDTPARYTTKRNELISSQSAKDDQKCGRQATTQNGTEFKPRRCHDTKHMRWKDSFQW